MRIGIRDILNDYHLRGSGTTDGAEVVHCASCGGRYSKPGTESFHFTRTPNKSVHLPMSVELCSECYKSVAAFKNQ